MKENSKVYDKITVGRRIRTQRVSQGLSRKQVAEQIGKLKNIMRILSEVTAGCP